MTPNPEPRSLRDLLADPAVYGEDAAMAGDGLWRRRLLAHQPLQARPRVISREREILRLLLLVGLPLVAIVLLGLMAYFGFPGLADWRPTPPSELRMAQALEGLEHHLPGGAFFWLIPLGLSALLTLAFRGRLPRILPLDW